jgi:hypothetical protein
MNDAQSALRSSFILVWLVGFGFFGQFPTFRSGPAEFIRKKFQAAIKNVAICINNAATARKFLGIFNFPHFGPVEPDHDCAWPGR